jgi:hypothetical protein
LFEILDEMTLKESDTTQTLLEQMTDEEEEEDSEREEQFKLNSLGDQK